MQKRRELFALCALTICLLTGCGGKNESEAQTDEVITTPEITAVTKAETTPDIATVTKAETTTVTEASTTEADETTAAPISSEPPAQAKLTYAKTVEIYKRMTLGAFVTDSNVRLLNADALLDTSKLGAGEIAARFEYDGATYEKKLAYTIKDTTKPVLLNGGYNTIVLRGEAFDLKNCVGYADNYDRRPKLTYTGKVNTAVCGEYPLTATVTDASGNSMSWKLTVKVADEKPKTVDNLPRLQFGDFKKSYGGEGRMLGIDVSKWQGNIDFNAVKKAGCEFVIMRIGHSRNGMTIDEYYTSNMAKAKAAGLKVGVYFYSTASSEKTVRETARWIVEKLDGEKLDFPVAFDWESFSFFQNYGMSIHDLNSLYDSFADELEQNGYSAMLYSSKSYLDNFWEKHGESPVWLAHYTDKTDYTGDYALWQMSCRGRIDGINGDVDLDILYTKKMN